MTIVHHERIAVDSTSDEVELIAAICQENQRRTVLRDLIGQDYATDPHGRPVAAGRSISISHTGELLALAMRKTGRVGVDAEKLACGSDIETLPAGLSAKESEMLMSIEPLKRCLAFTRVWTAKEAIAKALGLGNSVDFSQIEIDGELKFANLYGKSELAGGWRVLHRELEVAGEVFVVAIAVAK